MNKTFNDLDIRNIVRQIAISVSGLINPKEIIDEDSYYNNILFLIIGNSNKAINFVVQIEDEFNIEFDDDEVNIDFFSSFDYIVFTIKKYL
jgi:acyl carrier protein